MDRDHRMKTNKTGYNNNNNLKTAVDLSYEQKVMP